MWLASHGGRAPIEDLMSGTNGDRTRVTTVTGWRVNLYTMIPWLAWEDSNLQPFD